VPDSMFARRRFLATAMHPALSKRLTLEQLDEALVTQGLFGKEVELEARSYPIFFVKFLTVDGRIRLLRFDATNYDFEPIDVEPADPITKRPLELHAWMTRNNGPFPPHPGLGGVPFLCIKGTRAFYTHPSHSPTLTGQRWELHRRDLKLVDLLAFIRTSFHNGVWK
jgi:hypothetical protein